MSNLLSAVLSVTGLPVVPCDATRDEYEIDVFDRVSVWGV